MDCSLPGSSVHGALQASIVEWGASPFSRGISQPKNQTKVSCIAGGFFISWATREASPNLFLAVGGVSSVQLLSCIRLFATPWTVARQASLSITNSRSLLKLMFRVSDAIQPSHPLVSPSLPAFSLSQHQNIFQWVSSLHQVAKQSIKASASASVFPMNIQDWFPLWLTGLILQSKGLSRVVFNTTVQKHQFFQHSTFFITQLSHPCMTTGKTIALTRRTFVGKVMFCFLICVVMVFV